MHPFISKCQFIGMTGAEDENEASKPEEMVPDVKATTGSGKMPRYPNQGNAFVNIGKNGSPFAMWTLQNLGF